MFEDDEDDCQCPSCYSVFCTGATTGLCEEEEGGTVSLRVKIDEAKKYLPSIETLTYEVKLLSENNHTDQCFQLFLDQDGDWGVVGVTQDLKKIDPEVIGTSAFFRLHNASSAEVSETDFTHLANQMLISFR